jgi:hypothetical protein
MLAASRLGTPVGLAVAAVAYVAAFLFLSGIGLIAAGYAQPDLAMAPDLPGLTYPVSLAVLVIAALLCGAIWVYGTLRLRAILTTRTRLLAATVAGLSYLSAIAALWYAWSFDLDDKWIFLRTTRNVVRYGLPYWNPEDRLNVVSSFVWPYLTAPGIWLGDWDLFARLVGVVSFILTSIVIALQVRDVLLRAIAASAVVLFLPLLLWSMGALETAFATLVLICTAWYVFRRGLDSPLTWLLFGSMVFVRPDVVLVGAGAGVVYGLFGPGDRQRRALRGFVLIAPVVAFMAMNFALFDFPLPRPFYIKGWNKAFSGSYPLYYDMYIGASHLFSALSLSGVWLMLLGIFGWRVARNGRSTWRLDELALTAGALLHLMYVVTSGYQHMNYAFRYYIPSMVLLLMVAVIHVDRAIAAGALQQRSLFMSALVAGSLFVQIPFFGWATYHATWHEMALTSSPLRDRFSVHSYASVMQAWIAGSEYLREIERPGDRLFLWADMAGGAISDMYAIDQYYAPPSLSSFPEIRTCPSYLACVRLYDYILIQPDLFKLWTLSTHVVDRRFDNLWILKRATRVVDDLTDAAAIPSSATVQVVAAHPSGGQTGSDDTSSGVRLDARPSEPAALDLQIAGLQDRHRLIVVATGRGDGTGAPLSLEIRGSDRPADVTPGDEVADGGGLMRLAAVVEDGVWPSGLATIHLQVGGGRATSFEISEIRVVVDDATALVLDGQQLAKLTH